MQEKNAHTSSDSTRPTWAHVIEEAETELRLATIRVSRLKAAIRTFKKKREQGEPTYAANNIYLTTKESPLIHADGAVEHHINGRALAQLDFTPACQQDGSESHRSARARADTRSFPTLIREAADGRSRPRESRNSRGVAPAVATLLDLVFIGHDFLVRAFRIN